jgi:hypothetical protein
MFINELYLYIDFLKKKLEAGVDSTPKQLKYVQNFRSNLLEGINYYKTLLSAVRKESAEYDSAMREELEKAAGLLSVSPAHNVA